MRLNLLRGTLDMLILGTLEGGSLHGYDIARRIETASEDVLNVEEGSLYPALHRMERKGWIAAEWGQSSNNRRAKFYELTPEGRRQLVAEVLVFRHFVEAADRVLEAGTEPAT